MRSLHRPKTHEISSFAVRTGVATACSLSRAFQDHRAQVFLPNISALKFFSIIWRAARLPLSRRPPPRHSTTPPVAIPSVLFSYQAARIRFEGNRQPHRFLFTKLHDCQDVPGFIANSSLNFGKSV